MEPNKVVELFNSGSPWQKHPAFGGVFLKELVAAADTKGEFNCFIVKIEKGAEVGEHVHDTQWEFNEALEGSGIVKMEGKKYVCKPGSSFVNPPGISHMVAATEEDLYILAKFVPALK